MTLSQPQSLSLYSRFKQAKQIHKETSQATNANWFKDALAINLQLHIFVGSDAGAISYIRNTETGAWAKGPNITVEMEEDPSLLTPILEGIQKEYLEDAKKPGLGVILYVADEFSTAELGPEHQNPAEIEELRRLIIEDPESILEDHTISNTSHSWRLFPYPGAASGQPFATAIAFTRRHEALLEGFRNYGNENNLPIRTRALSAPLCAISSLPWLLEQKPENGFIALYHYPRFSVLSFFNIHGDLILIRTLQHHGNAPFSPQTASAIMTTTASLELENPHIFIIPMAGGAPMGMSDSLSSMLPNSQVITLSPTSSALHIPTAPSAANQQSDLGVTRPWKWSDLTAQTAVESEPTQADLPESETAIPGVTRPWKLQDMEAVAMLSQVRLEVISTTNPPSASKSALAESHTFKSLVEEMWPIQDFLPSPPEERALYPSQTEIKTLYWSKYFLIALGVLLLGVIATTTLNFFKAYNDPAWGYETTNPLLRITQYRKGQLEHDRFNKLLSDRSRAWSNMELLSRLFPDNEVIVTDFNYEITKETSNASVKGDIPIKRTWKIVGKSTQKGRDYLDSLNTPKGIRTAFKDVYDGTLDESFNLSVQSRALPSYDLEMRKLNTANFDRTRASGPVYDNSFNFTISQRFNGKDQLSLPK